MSESTFDVVIIGGGPGGYVCAIRAAQLGLKTALVEKDTHLGGTCLNVGCIPSKALLHSTEVFHHAAHGEAHGVLADNVRIDVARLMARKSKVVDQLRGGVKTLVSKRGITAFNGTGRLLGQGQVEIVGASGNQTLTARHIVLATGSEPVALPTLPFDGQTVVSSTEALAFSAVPKSMVVVGAGAIGLELGSVWARLGTAVTVVEFLPTIAGGLDEDLSKQAERIFKKQGIKIELETKVTGLRLENGGAVVTAEKKGKAVEFAAEKVLVAVGRRPFTQGLGLETAGVQLDPRGRIQTDDHLRTTAAGIWAIGDVIQGPMLAHKAEEDGVAVAEWIAGRKAHVDYSKVPGVIYTSPEIATVGLSERQCAERGLKVTVGKFPLLANGRAIAQDATDGVVKLIADANTDRLLGAAVIAAGASEMIASLCAHLEYGGSAEDIARTIHAHPTVSESIKEAALAISKSAIHAL